ncbi:MAG TPA: hypothetical protein V6C72_07355 [Chroococcales cyanobacterium]
MAKPSECREVADNFLADRFIWFDFPGLDPGVLDSLHAVLTGCAAKKPYTPEADILPLLYEKDPQLGCWVFRIPDDWIKEIANINPSQASALTKRLIKNNWRLKQLDNMGGVDVACIEERLLGLTHLCNQAVEGKSSLLLFVSL